VQRVITTPVTTGPVPVNNPNLLPVSEDGSVDSSLNTQDSECEGGIWDNYDDDNVSNAPEGAQLIPHDIDDINGTPIIGSPVGSPVGRQNDRDNIPTNIVPAPIQAPEGANRRYHGKAKQYPPAVWQRGADGKLERIAIYPPMAQQMSKKRMRLNYKQYLASLGDLAMWP
jgi:hypothetical protein